MSDVVFQLNDALGASLLIALGAAFAWGVASVLLSPCHLGTIPLVIGMVSATGQGGERGGGARLSFAFAGGMLVAVTVLGAVVAAAGWVASGLGTVTNYVLAAVFLVAGLALVGVLPLPQGMRATPSGERRGARAEFGVGLVLGLGLSPCTLAFVAPILALSFGSAAASPARGLSLLLAFGVGHCGVIGLAGASTEAVQRFLRWNAGSRALGALKMACGVLVLCAAAGLVYTA